MPLAGAAARGEIAFQSLMYKGSEIDDILRRDSQMSAALRRKTSGVKNLVST